MFAAVTALAVTIAGCKGQQPNTAGGQAPASENTAGGTSIPTLVNVNLQNVLNNLSVALNIDRANIPVNAQVPVDVAANVCGVSVNVLAASVASGNASCTATTTSPTLIQYVSQQLSAGGTGSQTSGTTNNMM
jgi:hypothetical protein